MKVGAPKGTIPWNKGKKMDKPPWNKGKKGLQVAWNKGIPHTDKARKKMSESRAGKRMGEEHPRWVKRVKVSCRFCKLAIEGRETDINDFCNRRCHGDYLKTLTGELHHNWIENRTQLAKTKREGERWSSAYCYWHQQVLIRDKQECKIKNSDCNGQLEVHHILSWRDYPELRYEINNGITLCHAHHPRGRAKEEQLIPTLQGLVANHLN